MLLAQESSSDNIVRWHGVRALAFVASRRAMSFSRSIKTLHFAPHVAYAARAAKVQTYGGAPVLVYLSPRLSLPRLDVSPVM